MAGYSIYELDATRVPKFVKCQFETFAGNPLHDVAYPTQEAAQKAHALAIRNEINSRSETQALYLVAAKQVSGDIVGGVICRYHDLEDSSKSSPHASAIQETAELASEDERYRQYVMNKVFRKRVREINGKHAIIDLLFVHPSCGRQGIGKDLLARACSMADERGLTTIVEASPAGKRTYESCGFQTKDTVTIPPLDWHGKPVQLYYWMEREAQTAM